MRLVTELGGVNDVLLALRTHISNPGLVEAACAALMALSMESTFIRWSGLLGYIVLLPLWHNAYSASA